jgi:hypothetical protein
MDTETRARHKHRPLNIKVRVFECKDDIEIRNWTVDIANNNKKDWLYDLVLWATLNGKVVEVVNIIDDKDI